MTNWRDEIKSWGIVDWLLLGAAFGVLAYMLLYCLVVGALCQ